MLCLNLFLNIKAKNQRIKKLIINQTLAKELFANYKISLIFDRKTSLIPIIEKILKLKFF